MDPNATLKSIAGLLGEEGEFLYDDMEELNELCTALDDWLGKGGFEPDWPLYLVATNYFTTYINRYCCICHLCKLRNMLIKLMREVDNEHNRYCCICHHPRGLRFDTTAHTIICHDCPNPNCLGHEVRKHLQETKPPREQQEDNCFM